MSPRRKATKHLKQSDVDVFLACRRQGCAWDYLSTGFYVTFNRYGYRRWVQVAPCLRGCESTQTQVQEPWLGGRRLSSKVWHPPAWYEFVGYYYSAAREEAIRRQLAAIDGEENLQVVYPEGFKEERAILRVVEEVDAS